MAAVKIHDWTDIDADYRHCLLLGNGSSIAVDPSFNYRSLLQEATSRGLLDGHAREIFERLGTQNFEVVLSALVQARLVNQALGIREKETDGAYRAVRNALIKTVNAIHPAYSAIRGHLPAIAQFMTRFETVLSLNYDLIVYWAMMFKNAQSVSFKDCFLDGRFRGNWEEFRRPIRGSGKVTLVFYPHGNLALATDPNGEEVKLAARDYTVQYRENLLATITDSWITNNYIPLFVSEGTSDQKKTAITQSSYLSTVYNSVLPGAGGPGKAITIYGCSISDSDRHIYEALIAGGVTRMAVSVRVNAQDCQMKCSEWKVKLQRYAHDVGKRVRVIFFNAEGAGCWLRQ